MRRALLVTGARVLADFRDSEAWAHRMLKIDASVIALYAPDGWSKTHGTRYTAERAKKAGIHVEHLTFEPKAAKVPA